MPPFKARVVSEADLCGQNGGRNGKGEKSESESSEESDLNSINESLTPRFEVFSAVTLNSKLQEVIFTL